MTYIPYVDNCKLWFQPLPVITVIQFIFEERQGFNFFWWPFIRGISFHWAEPNWITIGSNLISRKKISKIVEPCALNFNLMRSSLFQLETWNNGKDCQLYKGKGLPEKPFPKGYRLERRQRHSNTSSWEKRIDDFIQAEWEIDTRIISHHILSFELLFFLLHGKNFKER